MSFRGRERGRINRPFSLSSLPRPPNRTPGRTPAPSSSFYNQSGEESSTMSSNVHERNVHRTTLEEGAGLDLGSDYSNIWTAVSQIKDVCLANKSQNQKIEGRIKGLEDSVVWIRDAQKELSILMEKYAQTSFTIKGTLFEVRILVYSLL